ncbi:MULTISPECIES: low affinity iron permease family protein [unclassified Mesorhizobium]|uniref:low affinity iron permease family protein n=1 Tax=unclassified Mesorhizobium TaxID=325217 RepID=UPI001CCCA428|nr:MULTISPECIES: low affinity iron permease family protein [unclassified Mesorhizobium]MBZ9811170.1 low affinity iron permease family protein [Mesorhizobium sp. ESP-6-2]
MANHPITSVLTSIGTLTLSPRGIPGAASLRGPLAGFRSGKFELARGGYPLHLAMTLFIQRAEHRDTQAIHAKLDEMLRANSSASNITRIDKEEPEEIENHRNHKQQGD